MNCYKFQAMKLASIFLKIAFKVKTRFSQWVEQNFKILEEGYDFTSVVGTTVINNGANRKLQDYVLSLDAAKNLAMVSKTNKGKEVRQYFIQVEKDFNSPEKIMARALKIADRKIIKLEATIEEQRQLTKHFQQICLVKNKKCFLKKLKNFKKTIKNY